jgi:membrane protease YdiL (CAAX protease family)
MPNHDHAPAPLPTLGKVALFWGGYLGILIVVARVKAMVPAGGQLLWGLLSSAAIFLLTLLFLRRERRTVADVGLGFGWFTVPRLGLGLVLGLAVFLANLPVLSALVSRIRLAPGADARSGTLALTAASLLALSCMEELGFRAYPLRTLIPALGFWRAQLLVAVAFGLCHLAFGWSLKTILLGVVPTGLLLGVAAAASRGLALPVGLHAGLNLAQWATGGPGPWRIVVDPAAEARISAVANVTGLAIILAATALLSGWASRRQPRSTCDRRRP